MMLSPALLFSMVLAAANGGVIAVVDGKPITTEDIEPIVAGKLLSLRQRDYDIRLEAAKSIAFDRLQAAEAKKRAITVEELYRIEVSSKVPNPSEEEVKQLVTTLAPRLPKDPAQARQTIVESLRNHAIAEREAAYRTEVLARGKFDLRLQPPRVAINIAPTDAALGRPDAPVTIVEFSDFQCPYCNKAQDVVKKVISAYDGKVRLVFKHFPLESIHDNARVAAEAAVCAGDQKAFWRLHDWMFANAATLSRDTIVAAAPSLNLDGVALARCLDERRGSPAVEADLNEVIRLGVGGTPAFFVNGRLIGDVAVETFREVIDEELKAPKN